MNILVEVHRTVKNLRLVAQHPDSHHADQSGSIPVPVGDHRNSGILNHRIDHIQHHPLKCLEVSAAVPVVSPAVIAQDLRRTGILIRIDAGSQDPVPAVNYFQGICPLGENIGGLDRILLIACNHPLQGVEIRCIASLFKIADIPGICRRPAAPDICEDCRHIAGAGYIIRDCVQHSLIVGIPWLLLGLNMRLHFLQVFQRQ
ncbi:hypothetical protein D3C73_1024510 [compost metagenome]